jgi:hypothetical protein
MFEGEDPFAAVDAMPVPECATKEISVRRVTGVSRDRCGYCAQARLERESLIQVSCGDHFCAICVEMLQSLPGRAPLCPLCLGDVAEFRKS